MTSPDRPTLDYAGLGTHSPRPPLVRWRLFIGGFILGVSVLGVDASYEGVIASALLNLSGVGLLLFEYVRGWRSRDE